MPALALLLAAAVAAHPVAAARQPVAAHPVAASREPEAARWARRARDVTIARDEWGIAHIKGRTDADAVFGALYAQAEDDFNRIETNYLNAMGRLAEAEGAGAVFQDLRMKLFIDPVAMKRLYATSPAWLKQLMIAFADGLNYYLATHPGVQPRVLRRFEPWMALTFSEGSIGGDIERVDLAPIEALYGGVPGAAPGGAHKPGEGAPSAPRTGDGAPGAGDRAPGDGEPRGSNGIAIAPANTAAHHALLLINPHTSFFFRSELQMTSDEGLNAYGAATWGQFFIYQGFNDRAGWMHTSSGADAIDEYLETPIKKGARYTTRRGAGERPVTVSVIEVPYKTAAGMARRSFTVYRTAHGPVVRKQGDRWVSIALMHDPVKALTQSYTRTKARTYAAFRATMELHTNSSNNTVFASADGDIAYFHANFIPRRDPQFDWSRPVDGSDSRTDWRGLLSVDETPHLLNPASGWLYNSNNWPWSAAGASSPRRADYPAYVETGVETARGRHAVRVLDGKQDFTAESLLAAAYDSYLPWFERTRPALLSAWDALPAESPVKAALREQIDLLRGWDLRWALASTATSLAVFWGDEVQRRTAAEAKAGGIAVEEYVAARAPGGVLLQSLQAASGKLAADFGQWRTPWGEINRFQRLTGDIVQPFNDAGVSLPVGFTSAVWGSLASFGAKQYPGTKRWYGTSGNSFVAVVEFGDRVRARAITAGGASGDPRSPHFNDQAGRYGAGDLREVYFHPDQLAGHLERTYHPG